MSLSFNTELTNKLIEQQLISEQQLVKLKQSRKGYPCVPIALVKEGMLSSERLLAFCEASFNVPRFDITELDSQLVFEKESCEKLVLEHCVLPLSLDGRNLTLVTSDPSNTKAQDAFEFNSGLPSSFAVCDPITLEKAITEIYPNSEKSKKLADLEVDIEHLEIVGMEDNKFKQKLDAPIIVYVNKVLTDAIKAGASDIHFEPYEQDYRVRFRVDGVLTEASHPPSDLSPRLAARIKVIANMDIAEKRLPQDGRIKVRLSLNHIVEFRVSSLPTIWGEKIALRILHSPSTTIDLDDLGFEAEQKTLFQEALTQPQGLLLVTGPTGSGKSLSLYTGLNLINTEEKNISTAEDPVEIHLKGINQVQINTKSGLTFATTLRAFLRQDPDVIMVGEIRDLETAEIAIKASQTGHLVLSTLHTNSAAETLSRLLSMGIPSYNIISSLSLIMAQRLVRRLCSHCKEVEELPPTEELVRQGFAPEQLSELVLYKASGCNKCNQGYKGRIGIFEVIKPSLELNKLVLSGADPDAITEQLKREEALLLRHAGLLKVCAGDTSLAELNRVTKVK